MKCKRKIKTEKRRKYPKEEKAKNKQRNIIYEISKMLKRRKKKLEIKLVYSHCLYLIYF